LLCQHPAGNAGAVCRAQASNCDIAESCTGSSTACPADALLPDGTTCDDSNACTLLDKCTAGVCVGNPFTCSGHGVCTSPPGTSTPSCECDPGYIGDDCSIPDPVADITPTFQCVFA